VISRTLLALAFGLLLLAPARPDSPSPDSPLVKSSSDQRIRITLLYIGPTSDPAASKPFVLVYLLEDCRSDDEITQHTIVDAGGPTLDVNYTLMPWGPELKDAAEGTLTDVSRSDDYKYLDVYNTDQLKQSYPHVRFPHLARPDRARLLAVFYDKVHQGPFDITFRDHIPASGYLNIQFNQIALGTSYSSSP
jgi:hypothetical protein